MVQKNSVIKVIVIAGATSVGKTDVSINLASMFNGEIVNADASQFRKYLNIGTAKITNDEMKNIKHHLIDIIEPNEDFSIYDYQKMARNEINEIVNNNHSVFIVGGSGLYIDALINDYELLDNKNNHNDDEYDTYSNQELYEMLEKLDSELAKSTHQNNRKRVIRYIQRAKSGSQLEKTRPKAMYDCLFLFLNRSRDNLYDRINKRVNIMLDNHWIDEVRYLKNKNIDITRIKEIGYKEINDYLNNKISYNEMVDLIQKQTRHYAKRQITWFKNKSNSIIIDLDNYNEQYITNLIKNFLK